MKTPAHNYRLLPKKGEESRENEIRVKAHARPFVYAAYAGKLLLDKKHEQVYMLATGSATPKAIQAVEYVRQRVPGLMACYEIESTEFVDEYEPLVEGLDRVQVKRLVPTLKAHLFLAKQPQLQAKPGFMPAVPEAELLDTDRFRTEVEEHFAKERPARYHDEGEGGRRGGHRGRYGGQRGDYGGPRPRGGRGYEGEQRRDYEDRPRTARGGNYGGQRAEGEGQGYRGESRRGDYEGQARPRRGDYEGQGRGPRRGGYEGQSYRGGQRGDYEGQSYRGGQRGDYEGHYRGENRRGGYEGQGRGENRRGGYEGGYGGGDNRQGNFRGDRPPRGQRRGDNTTFRGQ